jgi:hypothetical protein
VIAANPLRAYTLYRLEQTPFATYGQMLDEANRCLCVTLERPWVDANHDGISDRNVSCISPGRFDAVRIVSPKHTYELFEVRGVPGRSNIEIHRGNLPSDSEGCILLGARFGDFGPQRGITGSAEAFDRFMASLVGVNAFTLVVVDP